MDPTTLAVTTPRGDVQCTADPKGADAVLYTLGGALRGTIHVTGTHHPQHWDRFTALRLTFGSVDAMAGLPPADSLPRLRNSTARHTARLVVWDGPNGPQWSQSAIESTAGKTPSPATRETLRAVLYAVAEHAARRPDRARILDASRVRETPSLLRFFASSRRSAKKDIARYEHLASENRRQARTVTSSWWSAARWLSKQPHPAVLLLLADRPGSLAREAIALPLSATWYEDAAAQERRRMERFAAEAASLRTQMQPHRRTAATDPTR